MLFGWTRRLMSLYSSNNLYSGCHSFFPRSRRRGRPTRCCRHLLTRPASVGRSGGRCSRLGTCRRRQRKSWRWRSVMEGLEGGALEVLHRPWVGGRPGSVHAFYRHLPADLYPTLTQVGPHMVDLGGRPLRFRAPLDARRPERHGRRYASRRSQACSGHRATNLTGAEADRSWGRSSTSAGVRYRVFPGMGATISRAVCRERSRVRSWRRLATPRVVMAR